MKTILATFKTPTGHKGMALFDGAETVSAAREKYPEAEIRVWSTAGILSPEDQSLLQLALQRAGRGIYGSRVLDQLYGINDYREGRLGR